METPKSWIMTSVKLTPEFYQLAKQNNIKITDALRTGISLMLAERGVGEYDNKLNLHRKMQLIIKQLEEKSQELELLKQSQTLKQDGI